MVYELRIYHCKTGSVQTVLDMWTERGQEMITPHMEMVGQWTNETGTLNAIYTIWKFKDWEDRRQARENLLKEPGFAEYLREARSHYVSQESVFLSPTALSPLR